MEIRRLAGEACKTTRQLWEEVFVEDSPKFVDYYYEKKASHNIAYVSGEEPYEAMLFRTPYTVQILDRVRELSYIVGVATREEFRHKGKMTALLMKAMEEMYSQRQPFTFLMPANPEIYRPFGFHYVYERPQWSFKDEDFALKVLEPIIGTPKSITLPKEEPGQRQELQAAEMESARTEKRQKAAGEKAQTEIQLFSLSGLLQELRADDRREAEGKIMNRLADFANQWLARHYQIYVKRDVRYFERQLEENQAENGDIFLLTSGEKLEGFFLYAREGGEIFIQEMMESQPGGFSFLHQGEEKKPIIMARIIHLEEMMKLIKSPHNRTVLIDIEDPLLPQNDGLYLWELTPFGSRVTRQREGQKAEVFMTVDELLPHLLQGVFLNEVV